jgi:hypothetical protein
LFLSFKRQSYVLSNFAKTSITSPQFSPIKKKSVPGVDFMHQLLAVFLGKNNGGANKKALIIYCH